MESPSEKLDVNLSIVESVFCPGQLLRFYDGLYRRKRNDESKFDEVCGKTYFRLCCYPDQPNANLRFGIKQGLQMTKEYRELDEKTDEIHFGLNPEKYAVTADLLEFTAKKLNTLISELRYCPDYREVALSYLGAFSEKQQYSLPEWSETSHISPPISWNSTIIKNWRSI